MKLRIAIVNPDKCKPKKCRQECKRDEEPSDLRISEDVGDHLRSVLERALTGRYHGEQQYQPFSQRAHRAEREQNAGDASSRDGHDVRSNVGVDRHAAALRCEA